LAHNLHIFDYLKVPILVQKLPFFYGNSILPATRGLGSLRPFGRPEISNPFGMQMETRSFTSGEYRFGFNGKEKDDEIKGAGNAVDFGARIYDGRLGRWLNVDPLLDKDAHEYVITNRGLS
jgi:RHS repeat-associated protein